MFLLRGSAFGLPLPFLLLVLGSAPARAQTRIEGRVVDASGVPLVDAKVQLLVRSDSSVARATATDAKGEFVLDGLKPGEYRIQASRLGYRLYRSDLLSLSGEGTRQVGPFVLQQAAVKLGQVVVEATKDLYELKPDRLVINVQNTPTLAGASVLEVLERAPGVEVDRLSKTVSMAGKTGVQVMVNGKLSYIPSDKLVDYLSGLNAANVDRIELITTPPASFDAEGNAGYINVVMKRRPDDGLSGSASLNGGGGPNLAQMGVSKNGGASTNLNYRRGRLDLYGDYSFYYNATPLILRSLRRITAPDAVTETPSEMQLDPTRSGYNARLALDYEATPRTTVGVLVAGFDNRADLDQLADVLVSTNGAPITTVSSNNHEADSGRHAMGNLNLQRKLGQTGTLRVDLDYLRYATQDPTTYLNHTTELQSGQTTDERVETGKETPLHLLVAKADYTRKGKRWEVGTGVKGAFSRFTNESRLSGLRENDWVAGSGFGTHSTMREDVLAAYAMAGFTPDPATTLNAGLRYELTSSNVGSNVRSDIVDRRFGEFFPSISLSRKLGESYEVSASYARRIERPSFGQMAPWLHFLDPYTFSTGNAALQPAIDNTLQTGLKIRSALASLQYAWEDSSISGQEPYLIPGYNIQVNRPVNLRGTRVFTGTLALPLHPQRWWSAQTNATVRRRAVDESQEGVPFTLTATSFSLNTTQGFTFPSDFTLEANGSYSSGALYGRTRYRSSWVVSAGAQKKLPDGATLALSMWDVFNRQRWAWSTGSPGDPLYIEGRLQNPRPSTTLTYTRRFGGAKGSRQRSTASEEERGRT